MTEQSDQARDNQPVTPPPRRRRRWLKKIAIAAGVLLLLIALFHRPLLHTALVFAVEKGAGAAGLEATLNVEGSIFSDLQLTNVEVAAIKEEQPLRLLRAERIALDYHFWRLITGDIPSFLQTVEAAGVKVELDTTRAEKKEPEPKKEGKALPKIPIPERIALEDINIHVILPTGELVLTDFIFILDEQEPGALSWSQLTLPNGYELQSVKAATEHRPGIIELQNLTLVEGVTLEKLVLNHEAYRQRQISLESLVKVAGGEIQLAGGLFAGEDDLALQVDLEARELQLPRLPAGLGEMFESGSELRNLKLDFTGLAGDPASWKLAAALDLLVDQEMLPQPAAVNLKLGLEDKQLQLDSLQVVTGESEVKFTFAGTWEDSLTELDAWTGNGQLLIKSDQLESWSELAAVELGGALSLLFDFNFADGDLTYNSTLEVTDLNVLNYNAGAGEWKLTGNSKIKELTEGGWPMLSAELTLELEDILAEGYAADTLTIKADTQDGGRQINIEQLLVKRDEDRISIEGEVNPADPEDDGQFTFDAKYDVDIPDLSAFSVQPIDKKKEEGQEEPDSAYRQPASPRLRYANLRQARPAPILVATETGNASAAEEQQKPNLVERLAGSLKAKGRISYDSEGLKGDIDLEGTGVGVGEFKTENLRVKGTIDPEKIDLEDFTLDIDGADTIQFSGQFERGEISELNTSGLVAVNDLSVFDTLLEELGIPTKLAGKAEVSLDVRGDPSRPETLSGSTLLRFDNVSIDQISGARLNGNIRINEGKIVIDQLTLSALDYDIELRGDLGQDGFRLDNLGIKRGELQLLTASGIVPWEKTEAGWRLNDSDPLEVVVVAEDLDVARLLRSLEMDPMVRGVFNLKLRVAGTPNDLEGSLTLTGDNVAAAAAPPDIRPADIRLQANIGGGNLTLETVVRQPLIQPLRITANIPMRLSEVIDRGGLDPNASLQARVQLPATNLDFLGQMVPAIRTASGTAGLDVQVAGTVNDPTFSGNLNVNMKALRFRMANVPLLTGLDIQVGFTKESVRIQQFTGQMAGGPFEISGGIEFPDLTNPQLDVAVDASQILVIRNDVVTARANVDLSATGPLDAVAVQGKVGITKGRFFKDIEILPLSLPGRPAPNQYEWNQSAEFSFPPIADWTFDINLVTDDPFLIRSNLARGKVVADIKMAGTGLKPTLDGVVRVRSLETSLPFSRMEFNDATLTFTPDRPLSPIVVATGVSRIRDYLVRATITGRLPNPSVIFSSDPPLPEEDIVSLIVTGATVDDLQSGGEVLAGRAILLLVQSVSQKLFPGNRVRNEDVAETLDKISVQIGGLDPRTGKQSASIRFRMTEKIILIGDLDVEGEFRGQVKYVIRFK